VPVVAASMRAEIRVSGSVGKVLAFVIDALAFSVLL
jgi:hypothetical protein